MPCLQPPYSAGMLKILPAEFDVVIFGQKSIQLAKQVIVSWEADETLGCTFFTIFCKPCPLLLKSQDYVNLHLECHPSISLYHL